METEIKEVIKWIEKEICWAEHSLDHDDTLTSLKKMIFMARRETLNEVLSLLKSGVTTNEH